MMGLLLLTLQGLTAVRLMGGPLRKWRPTAHRRPRGGGGVESDGGDWGWVNTDKQPKFQL